MPIDNPKLLADYYTPIYVQIIAARDALTTHDFEVFGNMINMVHKSLLEMKQNNEPNNDDIYHRQ